MLQIVEQLIAAGIPLRKLAGQRPVKNFIEPLIHPLVEVAEIRDGQVHHPLPRLLGRGAP